MLHVVVVRSGYLEAGRCFEPRNVVFIKSRTKQQTKLSVSTAPTQTQQPPPTSLYTHPPTTPRKHIPPTTRHHPPRTNCPPGPCQGVSGRKSPRIPTLFGRKTASSGGGARMRQSRAELRRHAEWSHFARPRIAAGLHLGFVFEDNSAGTPAPDPAADAIPTAGPLGTETTVRQHPARHHHRNRPDLCIPNHTSSSRKLTAPPKSLHT